MFNFRKHDEEICFAFHVGYQKPWGDFRLTLNFYKYEMTLERVKYV